MRIQLPNGEKITLDESLSLDEKINVVFSLVNTWRDVCLENWSSNAVKYFLDSLSSYLLWHKDKKDKDEKDEGEKDKNDYILSRHKIKLMNKMDEYKRKEFPIGDLTKLNRFIQRDEKRRQMKAEIKKEMEKSKQEVGEIKVWKEQPDS